jgi:hypothetical protein
MRQQSMCQIGAFPGFLQVADDPVLLRDAVSTVVNQCLRLGQSCCESRAILQAVTVR